MTTTYDMNIDTSADTLPAEFYDGVAPKRLLAWLIDVCFTALLSAPLIVPLALIGVLLIFPLLLVPVIWTMTSFLYRWITISNRSATWGMRLMAIELRDRDHQHLTGGLAFWHTLGTAVSFGFPVVQALSVVAMVMTPKGQGITDMVLNTAMVNKSL